MTNSNFVSKKSSNGLFFNAIIVVLSSYVGLFFAYIVQQSYAVFSYSVELTSYIAAHGLSEYEDMAYSLIRECYGFSDQNLKITIAGFTTFALFIVLLSKLPKESIKKPSQIFLNAVVVVSVIVWFVGPLIVVFSSIENPNMVYLIGWGKIPNSDVASLGQTIILLDRFRLFSRVFFYSFRVMVFATLVLLSSLSFSKWANHKLLFSTIILLATPVIVLLLFSLFSFPTSYYPPGHGLDGDDAPIWIEGVGVVYVGLIIRPYLEHLQSALWQILSGLWVMVFLSGIVSRSEKNKNRVMKAVEKLRSFFMRLRARIV